MRKLLFLLLFSLFFVFPKTEVFAQACELTCRAGYDIAADNKCYAIGDPKPADPTGFSCARFPGSKPNKTDIKDAASCICEASPGVPVAVPAAPAAAAAPPTKIGYAYGLPCMADTGVNADPKAIPAAGYDGFMTAIGCIPSKPEKLVNSLIKYSAFASGGVAFLIMIIAALQMITAEGNPETIKKAQERFYSAIIGLLLIIFSVLLMQVIGVDVLGLPGFGPATRGP